MQLHIVPDRQLLIEIHVLRHNANHLFDSTRVTSDILPSDAYHAARRLRLHRQHADDRRLARAVRAKQPEHLTVPNGERYPRNRRLPALLLLRIRMREFLDEILHLDHHGFHRSQSARN